MSAPAGNALNGPDPCMDCVMREPCAEGMACRAYWRFIHGEPWADTPRVPNVHWWHAEQNPRNGAPLVAALRADERVGVI